MWKLMAAVAGGVAAGIMAANAVTVGVTALAGSVMLKKIKKDSEG